NCRRACVVGERGRVHAETLAGARSGWGDLVAVRMAYGCSGNLCFVPLALRA
ncbi:unnamed protein product, partial [Symbiodinium microadriaticum]